MKKLTFLLFVGVIAVSLIPSRLAAQGEDNPTGVSGVYNGNITTAGSFDGHSGNAIEAPLHGVVSRLHVALGDLVAKGTPVLQMEAMKLVHTLKAPLPGRIGIIRCAVGDTVPAGAILVEIAPAEVEEKP